MKEDGPTRRAPRRSGRDVHSGDQPAIDAARFAADSGQTAADADQAASDADQTAAERDEADSASDQLASDRDQANADQQQPADANGVTLAAYETSRAGREATRLGRRATNVARARNTRSRVETTADREANASTRDETARRRDARAKISDRREADSDAASAEKVEDIRARAAAARVRAASDRHWSALDRADAAGDRDLRDAERAALEAQLRQAQKMEGIGLLAGGIAHDFNNILTVIRGNATLALAALPPEEGPREDLAQIVEAADRAADLIRQLLAFARRTVLKPEVVELGTIVRRLEPMLRRLIGEDVTLVTAAQGAGSVLADPGQIEQIIINLAVNARDAMPEGGKLTIETADIETAGSASPMTALSVSDTGMGMDAATMDHLFEPFFTTKGPGKGTGLGLATVYGIVNQSGGTVTAHSQPGHGSTFTVCLPRVAAITAAAEPPRPTATEVARLGTILVVEDDTGVRRFVRRVLEAAGYLVLTAPDGATAIEASLGVPLQLLLTDVVMPDMSGRRVAAKLAAQRPGIRVLYMSGYPDDDIVRHGVLEPDIDLLAKPFTAEALLSAIDKALARGAAD
jgi:signal transduction histidine kinase/ActR/RegA family two-component response regulator